MDRSLTIGKKIWVIPEGYIPEGSTYKSRELISHEAFCVVNTNQQVAHLNVTLYFTDKDPVGPYQLEVPGQRTRHFRFNDLNDPQPVPSGTDYSTVIEADVPIVVQFTRLDSRVENNALMTSLAFPA